jgi:hypothetical protein
MTIWYIISINKMRYFNKNFEVGNNKLFRTSNIQISLLIANLCKNFLYFIFLVFVNIRKLIANFSLFLV